MTALVLSTLAHTWLIDVDGTVLTHNGYLKDGDQVLPGVAAFWASIPAGDRIILMSARAEAMRRKTLAVLDKAGLRYDQAIFGLPHGERILINDAKPGGLVTALAAPIARDEGLGGLSLTLDPSR